MSWLFSSRRLDKHVSSDVFSGSLGADDRTQMTAALVTSLLRWVQVAWDAKMRLMKADGMVVESN